MWQIVWDPPAAREFDRLPEPVRESIYHGLYHFVRLGEGDIKALRGEFAGTLRLRLGDYRVRFRLDYSRRLMLILATGHRGAAYKS